ncbi:hypothetical protein GW742_10455 [Citrobacter freundii]|uniref:Fimbrial protein n=2 Tax=Enterobacteriaceae TaxID=543 RepID=A0ABT1BF52_9ENTR|nr:MULTISPECIES: hypothetical protein [Citrobacter]MBC6501888.1 hypothetical protein [Citrobacter freundii]MBC6506753.1 hypothetical protein [Citrobacter freundii]MBP8541714.1 hypothetical protein [Citrobacter sp. On2M]MBW5274523.1 hypothetical protein [Citrobacter sp. On28M]MCO5784487.1 hypothetical protein [Citrobacter meridianamericanus]
MSKVVMKINYYNLLSLFFTVMPLCSSAATSSATKLIPITATFVAPPCNVSFSDGSNTQEVNLGDITLGEKIHAPFSLKIECKYSRGSSINAGVVTGSLSVDDKRLIQMQDEMTGNVTPVYLSLKDSQSSAIEFNTISGADTGKPFCPGDSTRTCIITPVTTVRSGAGIVAGTKLTAAIIFTINNP